MFGLSLDFLLGVVVGAVLVVFVPKVGTWVKGLFTKSS
jgi:Flp pilus assembly pilin Flp